MSFCSEKSFFNFLNVLIKIQICGWPRINIKCIIEHCADKALPKLHELSSKKMPKLAQSKNDNLPFKIFFKNLKINSLIVCSMASKLEFFDF